MRRFLLPVLAPAPRLRWRARAAAAGWGGCGCSGACGITACRNCFIWSALPTRLR